MGDQKLYSSLIELDQWNIVPNIEEFQCEICFDIIPSQGGIILKQCLHLFCHDCVRETARNSQNAEVKCPATDCSEHILDTELRTLLSPELYEALLKTSLRVVKMSTDAFQCQTENCQGWVFYEEGATAFHCELCDHVNCIPCQVIHEGLTCLQYRETKEGATGTGSTFIKNLLDTNLAMKCPKCGIVVMKDSGCDFIQCSSCQLGICWATRGPRWGPLGKGDTSGGCHCNVNGKRCHPSCGNCH